MDMRRAYIFHTIAFFVQPFYHGIRWSFNRNYFSQASPVWLALDFLSWVFIVSQLTIPFLTCPFLHLPSPPGDMFPIGHAWTMREQLPPTQIEEASKPNNDGIIAVWMPFYSSARLVLTSPETAMEVLNTRCYDWEKPAVARKILTPLLGSGLINVEGNTHKAMRKVVTPPFSGRLVRDMVPMFWSKALKFVRTVSQEAKKSADSEVEITRPISRVTLDIIGDAALGADFDTIDSRENKLASLYGTITSPNRGPILLFFAINVVFPSWLIRKMRGTVYARVAYAVQELRGCIRDLLREKKQVLKEDIKQTDIIATIMKSRDFSDDYLCDQILTFFAAGHDTVAAALAWTSWLLAHHPAVQGRLRKECHDHLCESTSDQAFSEVGADMLDEMSYLTAVCDESLRLYPPVPLTARRAVVDTKIGTQYVPKGTHVVVAPWVMNRDPKFWGEDASEFKPERWIENSSTKPRFPGSGPAKSPYVFQTFLHGPRSCIGQNFAKLELKCLLLALVMRFHIAPPINGRKVEVGGVITMKPKGGMKLRLTDLKAEEDNNTLNNC